MAQYTKHNSNYIKTNIHQKLKDGSTIFERDWVTIGSQLHFGPGKIPYYTNGNFIFTTSPIPHYQKRYKNGVAVGLWTYDDVKNATNVVNKINNDEYTEDIRTYAYYGSCLELVRSSIEHIISNFPGNITVSDTEIEINEEKYYVLNNPFGIILNEKETQLTQYDNELHYLSYSWDKYEIKSENEFVDITSYEIKTEATSNCVKELDKVYTITINGSIVIEAYIYNGAIVPVVKAKDDDQQNEILKGMIIQPKKDFIEDYFNNLQGFEKQLLTRKTTPLYSNTFITPIEYNLGYMYYKRTYTWPSNGYCIDITSTTYIDFLDKLTSMAEIYDELWTDNLWRRMTHEAIKNYDWTYTKEFEDGEEQDNIDGGERMHKVLNIIGRVFDDVKQNIDLVKRNNRATYNGDRNIPNALLSDKLELMGWDAYSTISTYTIEETVTDENGDIQTIEREIPASEVKIEDEFLENYNKKEYKKVSEKPEDISQEDFDNLPEYISKEEYAALDDNVKNAYNKEYNNINWYGTKNNNELTFTDVDVNFMRKMLLSSKYILKTKGTRAAIDMIMGMFGYGLNGEDYSIIETYRKVKPKMYDYSDYEEEEVFGDKIVRLNAYKENERIYPDDEVSGIPVGSFKVQTNIGDICEFTTYLIPYYDQRKMYDGDFTFQSKGGWFYNGEERWIPNKQYYRCEKVFYDGSIWCCIKDNKDQTVFSEEYFEKVEIEQWIPYKKYYKGDRVFYNGSVWHYEEDNTGYLDEDVLGGIWRCKEDNTGYYDEVEGKVVFSDRYFEKVEEIEEWKPNEQYRCDRVFYDGGIWRCIKDNKEVEFSKCYFEKVAEIEEWIPNKQYYKDDRVFYDDHIWRCKEDNTDQNIFSENYFVEVAEIEEWEANKQYRCDRVFYNGSIWRCTENNTEQDVFSKEYFEKEEEKENQFKWTETLSYLHVVSTIKDLLNVNPNSVTNGNIYYVANVNDYIDYTEESTLKSNFFVLNNDFAPDMFSSWKNIDLNDPSDENAERAKYLDSIILNTLGNNPHVGFGGYDKGETYFEYMKKPFKYAIDRNFFSYEDMEDAKDIKFDVDEKDTEAEKSSDKIKIFADQDDMNLDEDIIPDYRELTKVSYVNIYKNDVSLTEEEIKWMPNNEYNKGDRVFYVGRIWHYEADNAGYFYEDALGGIWCCTEDNTGQTVFSDKYFEKDFKYHKCVEYNKDAVREAKKNIYYLNSKVVYFTNKIDNEQYKKYFKNVIMKYLMQVIPSTTILILQGFE